ncbi:MAG: entericidin A/B family lipoprotein [Gemmatimonadaceae bacterium]|nr:entericidin A/B family lipoprotein [Acetobacteraceae bacterium]
MVRPAFARYLLLAVTIAALAPALSACNTTAGVGEDVSATGRAVTRGAEEVKRGL